MEARALAEAYVRMDRLLLHYLKQTPEHRKMLEDTLATVERRISTHERAGECLQSLCTSGCEREELLWLLLGCDGLALPGFRSTQELFGRSADLLKSNIAALQESATIIESINTTPFGFLIKPVVLEPACLPSMLPDTLRSYTAAIQAAKMAFSHGAEWFLNVAKARLVDHVNYKSHSPHDEELSALIGAVARKLRYAADVHRQWRYEHKDLITDPLADPSGDSAIDPYTTQSAAARAEREAAMMGIMQDPACRAIWDRHLSSMLDLIKARHQKRM